ncbi:mitochondrial substrate carrier family protein V-like [Phoenix dactylifera]|uniref:Mitochondrial substrate carrier family protein V-like n=1 Tax=Phoenix dactylifera TaxID=42345 RepID=A0A8B9A2M0_PHODC|nr:mitochondrial substrate carrier family protein V-like [Phoenix dactylifera]
MLDGVQSFAGTSHTLSLNVLKGSYDFNACIYKSICVQFYTYESLKQFLLASAKPDASLNTLQTNLCVGIHMCKDFMITYQQKPEFSVRVNGYESLQQLLVCGGLAGSSAALFTTPFGVVKTRLQTQAPGTLGRYNGVLHALQEIAREEGLQGLYRGLALRLAMYVSQGAIIFASYEFLKAVFALEVPQPPCQVTKIKHKADDLAPSRMHKWHS